MDVDRGWPDEAHLASMSGKNLVLCLDGTNDEIGVTRPTNPAKVFEMLDLDNPSVQVAYYDPGVGTLPSPTAVSALGRVASRGGELAFGWGIKAKLAQAYTWLMNTYRPGDRVYLFGFSRGAYTARALAAMLGRPGLLRSGSLNLVNYAIKEYIHRDGSASGLSNVQEFADSFCWGTKSQPMNPDWPYCPDGNAQIHSIPIEFMGIWDTVEATGFGIVANLDWPDTSNLWNVKRLRHAVSIDEHRRPYRETLVRSRDDFEEVWFSGVHSDVGGTFKNCELATIALKWVFDGVCVELLLRNQSPQATYAKYCTVEPPFATADIHNNNPAWTLLGTRKRPIPDDAMLHETVRVRRQHDRTYLPHLVNADLPTRWADTDWTTTPINLRDHATSSP